jgi:predicted phosphoadenosine phosphosulfate sulfurtransferase
MEHGSKISKIFLKESVLEKSCERISLVFDNFKDIIVSVSSGKDSTVLYWLLLYEAIKRNRKIGVFFLDQEAEYKSSVDIMGKMMAHPLIIPLWYQVPLRMTNATSYENDMLNSWGVGESWIREKHPLAIHEINEPYPDRFYGFVEWFEKRHENTAFFIGLRAEESLDRQRAVINPGWQGIRWCKKAKGRESFKFYPLYDWSMGDIWKFIYDNKLPYNIIYDKMYHSGKNYYKKMRVSNLIHEKSFKGLADLQIYEPDTFNKLIKRLPGVHVASIYAQEKSVFNVDELPKKFDTWLDFRDYLLKTCPLKNKDKFVNRFNNQPKDEEMYRRQVRQILLNDYENNLAVRTTNKSKNLDFEKWWNIL